MRDNRVIGNQARGAVQGYVLSCLNEVGYDAHPISGLIRDSRFIPDSGSRLHAPWMATTLILHDAARVTPRAMGMPLCP